jgi:hypothetical protein
MFLSLVFAKLSNTMCALKTQHELLTVVLLLGGVLVVQDVPFDRLKSATFRATSECSPDEVKVFEFSWELGWFCDKESWGGPRPWCWDCGSKLVVEHVAEKA